MIRPCLFVALLALISAFAPATSAGAQATSAPVREKVIPAQRAAPSTLPLTRQARPDPAHASKSVSEKLFDARWVLFPARLALVIVFLTIALLLLMFGAWSAVRVAHSLRHMKWGQPPRRLKRGELGAAGTSLAVEWEERLSTNIENDEERDRQIASLRDVVDRLARDHNRIAARLAAIGESAGIRPDEQAEDLG